MNALVSIVMAACNGERFIARQIDTILNQTYPRIELIVRDDCSEDGTFHILQEYAAAGKLTLFRNETKVGYVKTFERLITDARGDFIALADQDDVWENRKIEQCVNNIGACSLIFSDLSLIDSREALISRSFIDGFRIRNVTRLSFEPLLYRNYVSGCSTVFRSELKKKLLPFPAATAHHDHWIALMAASEGGLRFIREPLVGYRQHGNNCVGIAGRHQRADLEASRQHCRWLQALSNSPHFTEQERKQISEALLVFTELSRGGWRRFYCLFKYRNRLFSKSALDAALLAMSGIPGKVRRARSRP